MQGRSFVSLVNVVPASSYDSEISGRRESMVYRETKIISSAINGTRTFKRGYVGGRNNSEADSKRDSTHRSQRSIAAVDVAEDKRSQALDPESDDETTYSHVDQKEQKKQNDEKYKQERVKNKYKASAKESKDVKRDQLLSTLRYFAGRPK
jgi:Mg-chelatase subunit ChlI